MILGLCLICVVCLGSVVAAVAARSPSGAALRRAHDQPTRRLYQSAESVSVLDVESLLLADGVPAASVSRVLRRAETRRICARTMWLWADRHGSERLVDVLDAGLAEHTLLDHLDTGSTPDWHWISVFADLANDTLPAGMPLDELVDLDAVPDLSDLMFPSDLLENWTTHPATEHERAACDALPLIADPGFGPFSPTEALEAAAAQPRDAADEVSGDPSERAEHEEGGGDWPAVA